MPLPPWVHGGYFAPARRCKAQRRPTTYKAQLWRLLSMASTAFKTQSTRSCAVSQIISAITQVDEAAGSEVSRGVSISS